LSPKFRRLINFVHLIFPLDHQSFRLLHLPKLWVYGQLFENALILGSGLNFLYATSLPLGQNRYNPLLFLWLIVPLNQGLNPELILSTGVLLKNCRSEEHTTPVT